VTGVPNEYETVEDALAVVEREACAVPAFTLPGTCPYCFGSQDPGYPRCFGCTGLINAGARRDLLSRVVPMTMVWNPSPWYSRLQTYKTLNRENMALLAATVYEFFNRFPSDIQAMLGGPIDAVCVTPSKRGVPMAQQPLRRLLELVDGMIPPVEDLLTHNSAEALRHNAFNPNAFEVAANVKGRRVVLLEDTWVTGATAASAGTTLQLAGAAAVAIFPIARCLNSYSVRNRHGDSAYVQAASAPWRPTQMAWPRP
jgi:adenine/guanine phosphoribosyltransferase-like PRPP-binding protein